ncbi:hypothetical protein GO491_07520 [Flavobacteriaceae bacterium Ap0902]|nr:hypothetical protein [Flavobacteriaceae bacterium Ap0902]
MRNEYFENETAEKTFGFKVIIALVGLMSIAIAAVRLYKTITADVMIDPTLTPEPLWYNYTTIVLVLVTLVGLYYTWKFRKMGVYMVIISLFTIIVLNPEFDLFKTLAPLFTLFIFVGYGLFEIIPKWRFFK